MKKMENSKRDEINKFFRGCAAKEEQAKQKRIQEIELKTKEELKKWDTDKFSCESFGSCETNKKRCLLFSILI
ncbi:hypothetical protein [Mycoplasmoides pneumoniae]|uniref:hypothetical protein n=3 Tax=Mycoplasmoides pneumoniae TaxID=2104 RepID=UPI0013960FD0|nr:hypothetical protein [Mycoplasmoides pneumoniae]